MTPDSYVREQGKEKFEAEMLTAVPLSQYIVQHLSEENSLNSQEDKIKFLNEAEPILRQIKAPKFSLMLRKRIAELAEVTDDEMQRLLKLPLTTRAPANTMRRKSRSPLSIKKRFIVMALMRPDLVSAGDSAMLGDSTDEDVFLKAVLKACIAQRTYNSVALLDILKNEVDPVLMQEIEQALHNLDESLDIELDFLGARTQLTEAFKDKQDALLLNELKEKPLSALSDEDRDMLKQLTAK